MGEPDDAHGNMTSLTPPGKTGHSFGYAASDKVETYTPPGAGSAGTFAYDYDDDRRPTSVDVPGPGAIALAYDSGGRLTTTTFSRGATAYAYQGQTSKLAGITAPGGQGTSFAYDGSLLTSIASTGAAAGSVSYTYNADLMVSGATVPGSAAVAYGYDSDGLLTSAGALSLTRHAANATLSTTTLGQVSSTHSYNGFAEPTGDTFSAGTAQLYNATYTRDALGRIGTKTETVAGTATTYDYTYDARGRLTDVTKDGAAWRHYAYDSNGNRTAATEGASSFTGDYDAQDRIVSYGVATYQHNPMGQRTTKTVGTDTTTYDYDELGNLTGVDLSTKSIDYIVDGLNRRVARKVDGSVTNRYLYGSGILPVAELNADQSVKSRFVYASKSHVPDYMIRSGVTYRFVTDQVGSVRLVVNTTDGTIVQRIDYDPFGKVVSDTNPGFQPFGFAGGLYDADTGLVRFGARDYDAETGRWTAKDPILFDGGDSNVYAYVGSDPINRVDPAGLEWWDPVDIVRAGIDGVGSVVDGIGNLVSGAISKAKCIIGNAVDALYNWQGWDEVAVGAEWVAKGAGLAICVVGTLGGCAAAGGALTFMDSAQDAVDGTFTWKKVLIYGLWNGVPILGGVGGRIAMQGLKKGWQYALKFYTNYPSILCTQKCEMPR